MYGGYYTNENQVIIGKSLAKSISNNIKDLIGEYYEIKLPDKAYRLEIVGIADFGDDIVSEYFMNSQGLDNANDVAYLNNEFLRVSKKSISFIKKYLSLSSYWEKGIKHIISLENFLALSHIFPPKWYGGFMITLSNLTYFISFPF